MYEVTLIDRKRADFIYNGGLNLRAGVQLGESFVVPAHVAFPGTPDDEDIYCRILEITHIGDGALDAQILAEVIGTRDQFTRGSASTAGINLTAEIKWEKAERPSYATVHPGMKVGAKK
jgi:hypothetical protein